MPIRVDFAALTVVERSCTIVHMRLPSDDRTARARIRDEALKLFADVGPDVVTVRGIAEHAGVSPSLVIRHYRSKDGLRAAVDGYVIDVFEAMLAQVPVPAGHERSEPAVPLSFVEVVTESLPHDSAIPAYLGRMLIDGGPAGSTLFQRLHEMSRATLSEMIEGESAVAGADPEVRAAFLLVTDLAAVTLRNRLTEVLDFDPLSPNGLRRWGAEVLTVYRGGLLDDAGSRTATNDSRPGLHNGNEIERNSQ